MDPAGFGIGCARFHRQPQKGSAPLIAASCPVGNGPLPFCDGPFPVRDGPFPVRDGPLPFCDASFPVCDGPLPFCDASFPVFDGPWGVRGIVGRTLRPLGGKSGSFSRLRASF